MFLFVFFGFWIIGFWDREKNEEVEKFLFRGHQREKSSASILLLFFSFFRPQLTGAWDIICWARLPPLPFAMATTSRRAGASLYRRGEGAASGAAALRREIELVYLLILSGGIRGGFKVHCVSMLRQRVYQ